MRQKKQFLNQVNLETDFSESSFNQSESTELKEKLRDLKVFIDEMHEAVSGIKNVPEILQKSIKYHESNYLTNYNKLLNRANNSHNTQDSEAKEALNSFHSWYNECIGNQPKENYLAFLDTYNTAKNFSSEHIKKGNTKELKSDDLIDDILQNKKAQEKITQETRKIAGKTTISKYAQIFGKEAEEFSEKSNLWLKVGVASLVAFILLIIFIPWDNILPTETILQDDSVKYQITNILLKSLLLGVLLFFISFTFKQYAINKHNSVVNQQRGNAMNSYLLFVESTDPNDSAIRHTLMEVLAKAIYEQSSTGFIADKNPRINSGIVEVTKMVGENRPIS